MSDTTTVVSLKKVYENVFEYMRECMGAQLYTLWNQTQRWDPNERADLRTYQDCLAVYPCPTMQRPATPLSPPPLPHERSDTFIDALNRATE